MGLVVQRFIWDEVSSGNQWDFQITGSNVHVYNYSNGNEVGNGYPLPPGVDSLDFGDPDFLEQVDTFLQSQGKSKRFEKLIEALRYRNG